MNKTENLTNKAYDTVQKGVSAAKRDYPELNDIKENVTDLKNNSAALARHVYADGRQSLSSAGDVAAERISELRETGLASLKRMEGRVSRNPGQSVLIAFAAGLLTSFILGRK